ncbi:hypothetical protein C8Q73DRAFT_718989 [Cubamyces lactineus]|nr:hypothetical protein C8Q73DRAFT_718989 [Cubamyces lactineus]
MDASRSNSFSASESGADVGYSDSVIIVSTPTLSTTTPIASLPHRQATISSPPRRKTRSGRTYGPNSAQTEREVQKRAIKIQKRPGSGKLSVKKGRKTQDARPPTPHAATQTQTCVLWQTVDPPGLKPYGSESMLPSGELSKPPPSGKPRIWATSREELIQIVPEFAQSHHDVVHSGPWMRLLFLEGSAWKEDKWDGGMEIEMSMVRSFTRSLPDLPTFPHRDSTSYNSGPTDGTTPASAFAFPGTPEPPLQVIDQDGTYRFVQGEHVDGRMQFDSQVQLNGPAELGAQTYDDAQIHVDMRTPSEGVDNENIVLDTSPPLVPPPPSGPPVMDVNSLAPECGPPEIEALLSARTAYVPISIVLCRNAEIAPFMLPIGCGCAFLGFFYIQDVQVRTEDVTWEVVPGERPSILIRGHKVWRFRFKWISGGDSPDPSATPCNTPWWMEASAAWTSAPTAPMHPYTLLPLQFFAPPALLVCTEADVVAWKGWHCKSCGMLNMQRNLCFQRCDGCSMGNGLQPICVEYVRQVRGTDPVSLPWDRYGDAVICGSSDGPDGLRRFTYVLSSAQMVHHLFTRNRPEAQEEPSRLFSELQADIELIPESAAKSRPVTGSGPYYICQFDASAFQGPANNLDGLLPSAAPQSVRSARELMLRRAWGYPCSEKLNTSSLVIRAWRTAGNRKGCLFAAEAAPVAVMCLGADVEFTFWQRRRAAGRTNHADYLGQMASAPIILTDDAPDEAAGCSSVTRPTNQLSLNTVQSAGRPSASLINTTTTRKTGPSRKGGKGVRDTPEDVLMVTLVHGDVLVVHGGTFEYSIKRTGMSIVLFTS